MSDTARFFEARDIGCPVLAARVALYGGSPLAHYLRLKLQRGDVSLPLPPKASLLEEMSTLLNREPALLKPIPGVYCLSTREWDNCTVGIVQHLEATPTRPRLEDEFSRGCSAGEQAALEWIYTKVKLASSPEGMRFEPCAIPPLHAPRLPQDTRTGRSAGLAAAVATVWSQLSHAQRPTDYIAATGCVNARGKVLGVTGVQEKVMAVLREAPFVTTILLPHDNLSDVPTELAGGLRVFPVSTVSDALNELFPDVDESSFVSLAADQAAELAEAHEIAHRHSVATRLAENILEQRDSWHLNERDALYTEVVARRIHAINETHQGRAKAAIADFLAIHELARAATPSVRRSVFDLSFRARVAAYEASAYIDVLEPERAVAVCEPFADHVDDIEPLTRIALLGSWTRALTAAGDLEAAQLRSDQQLDITPSRRNRDQRIRTLCNRIGVFLRLHQRGHEGAAQEAEKSLAEAKAVNAALPPSESTERNAQFNTLWELRICAAKGDAARARSIVERPPIEFEGWPDHHRYRFAAEALATAGRTKEAIEMLEAECSTIPSWCGGFLRVVLLTAAARRSLLLKDQDRDDWAEPAWEFLSALQDWMRDGHGLPKPDAAPTSALVDLKALLAGFPY